MRKYDKATLARAATMLAVADAAASDPITGATGVEAAFGPLLWGYETERFAVLAVDRKLRPIGAPEVISIGSDGFTIVDTPGILRWVLTRERRAAGAFVAHNHPSGDATPSHQDVTVTRALETGFRAVGLTLFDHLVIARPGVYASLRDKGMLTGPGPALAYT